MSRSSSDSCAVRFPDLHRVALDERVAVLAAEPRLGQREQHPLRVDEAAHAVEVLLHPLGIDEQLVDDAGQPGEREIERDRRVRADEPLDRRVRDVALVPQRDILQRRRHIAADHAREAGQILGQHRVALVRHRRAALLPGREIFLGLEHLGALQVADFGRQPLDRRSDHAKRREEHRVAVARDDLGRDRLGASGPSSFATCSSTLGGTLAKVPIAPEIAQVATSSRAATSRSRLRANSA